MLRRGMKAASWTVTWYLVHPLQEGYWGPVMLACLHSGLISACLGTNDNSIQCPA